MIKIFELLSRDARRPKSAAELGAAVMDAQSEHDRILAEINALAEKRAAALLQPDGDEALDRIEADQAKALRELERAEAAIEELRRRKREVEIDEDRARIDALYGVALMCQEKGAVLLARYHELAAGLRDVLAEIEAANQEREAANTALREAGDPRHVSRAEEMLAQAGLEYHHNLVAKVALPSTTNAHAPLWPMVIPDERHEVMIAARARLTKDLHRAGGAQ